MLTWSGLGSIGTFFFCRGGAQIGPEPKWSRTWRARKRAQICTDGPLTGETYCFGERPPRGTRSYRKPLSHLVGLLVLQRSTLASISQRYHKTHRHLETAIVNYTTSCSAPQSDVTVPDRPPQESKRWMAIRFSKLLSANGRRQHGGSDSPRHIGESATVPCLPIRPN